MDLVKCRFCAAFLDSSGFFSDMAYDFDKVVGWGEIPLLVETFIFSGWSIIPCSSAMAKSEVLFMGRVACYLREIKLEFGCFGGSFGLGLVVYFREEGGCWGAVGRLRFIFKYFLYHLNI